MAFAGGVARVFLARARLAALELLLGRASRRDAPVGAGLGGEHATNTRAGGVVGAATVQPDRFLGACRGDGVDLMGIRDRFGLAHNLLLLCTVLKLPQRLS